MKWDIKRGDIIMCDLGMHSGSVQSGIRPCVVVSNDTGNKYSTIYTVVPLTTKLKHDLPTHVCLAPNSYALCEQCTTISEQQVLRTKRECIGVDQMKQIDNALCVALDL